MIPLMVTWV